MSRFVTLPVAVTLTVEEWDALAHAENGTDHAHAAKTHIKGLAVAAARRYLEESS